MKRLLFMIICVSLLVSGCTSSGSSDMGMGSDQYADSSASRILSFAPSDVVSYIGLDGPGDKEFYGGRYTVDGGRVRVQLDSKEVGGGAFQKIDTISMTFTIIDADHVRAPDGTVLLKYKR